MTDRNTLATLIHDTVVNGRVSWLDVADAVIAAGWRQQPPRRELASLFNTEPLTVWTNSKGDFDIPHGLPSTPFNVIVRIVSDPADALALIQWTDSDVITARAYQHNGHALANIGLSVQACGMYWPQEAE